MGVGGRSRLTQHRLRGVGRSIYYPLQNLVDCFWQPPVDMAILYTENNSDVIAVDLHSKKTIHETASGRGVGARVEATFSVFDSMRGRI